MATPARATAMIEVEDLRTVFGDQVVHDGVGFTIARGELVAIIGGSGTGKSVLLREIAGLHRPTGGRLRLLGSDVWAPGTDLDPIRRRVGMLFQDGALFSSLSVAENVAVPLREHTDLPPALIEQVVLLRLALAGLDAESGAKMPSELSGGMRKRAGVARALALEPELLFLDEPTSGLDPVTARAFDALMLSLNRDLGLTVMLITHDLDTLASIPTRIIVLGKGKVIADGRLEDIRSDPDPWVQSYFSTRPPSAA